MYITYRKPTPADGQAVHQLIQRCPPLDQNSLYCNLLQCRDFSDTSIIAQTEDGTIAGFISGYIPQSRPDTLFIWQVALSSEFRGQGIANTMLTELFRRNARLTHMETTISPSNQASRKLFTRFFKEHFTSVETKTLFKQGVHFNNYHEDEVLYLAGPAIRLDQQSA